MQGDIKDKIRELAKLYFWDPYAFVCDQILLSKRSEKFPTPQQKGILDSLTDKNQILISEDSLDINLSAKSGHGTGKSSCAAWIIIWFLWTRNEARIGCTAPTGHQLNDVLWAEIKKWIAHSSPLVKNRFEVMETHVFLKDNRHQQDESFAVAISCSKPENLQGLHSRENMMFIVDEASGVPEDMIVAAQGTMTAKNNFFLMLGNPTVVGGSFYNCFHKNASQWIRHTLSSIDSPIVPAGFINRYKEQYGEDSDIFRVRVLGEFPMQGEDSIISYSAASKAQTNDFEEERNEVLEIGVDVARYGDDDTVIVGRKGNKVVEFEVYAKKGTMETAGYAIAMANRHPGRVVINVDDTGVGGGVTDRLNELNQATNRISINPVNNGEKASNPQKFNNRGAELWWNMRERIETWDIPNDSDLIGELTTRKYKMLSSGKIEIEPKSKMKERLGSKSSPDKADALSLAFMGEIGSGLIIDVGW